MLRRATEETGQGSWAERVVEAMGTSAISLPRGTVELKPTGREEARGVGMEEGPPLGGGAVSMAWDRRTVSWGGGVFRPRL